MNTATYQLPSGSRVLSHFPARVRLVRDGAGSVSHGDDTSAFDDADMSELMFAARIRSGDYFASVAMELDKIAQGLHAAHAPETPDIEQIVSELLFLHEHFELRRK